MLPGFTSYFLFEFKDGIVHYKDVGLDGEIVIVKSQTFCPDPAATKKILLRELLNLSHTSNVVEIVKALPRLPPLPARRVSKKKIDNMKVCTNKSLVAADGFTQRAIKYMMIPTLNSGEEQLN